MALASANAAWAQARRSGLVVGLLAFDLTVAFDTITPTALLSGLQELGVSGLELQWFTSYMSGGCQKVEWNSGVSDFLWVPYGVRQGSILGPFLFLIVVRDIHNQNCLTSDSSAYADDSFTWAVAPTVEEVSVELEARAKRFLEHTREKGLCLNPAKTQLLYSGAADVLSKFKTMKSFPAGQ
jgi:hypothetical protein